MTEAIIDYTDEDQIVACCESPERRLVNNADDPALVVGFLDDAVVKFGTLSKEEEQNQRFAHSLLDPQIVRVPKAYHYFSRDSVDYLIMEYIEGNHIDNNPTPEGFEQIVRVIEHIASHHGHRPGPLGGGVTHGLLFENEHIEIENLQDLQNYWNDRLLHKEREEDPVNFEQTQVVLVHGDFSPRNIIFCKDGKLALLDWSHAGFFPRCFERASLNVNNQGGRNVDFAQALASRLQLSEAEEVQEQKVLMGWFNSHRYSIHSRPVVYRPQPPVIDHKKWDLGDGMNAKTRSELLWKQLLARQTAPPPAPHT